MPFPNPLTWLDGLRRLRARKPLPTSLGSRDIQTRLGADLKRWSVFSAKVENIRALQTINDVVARLIGGISPEAQAARNRGEAPLKLSVPDAKHELEQTFRKLGVGVDDPRDIGTIKDPTSDARLQLIVNTQENLAYGYGRYIATQDPDTLDLWPCWELVRVSPVNVPRGFKLGLGGKIVPVSGDSWPERWAKVGGQRYDGGRMIALKNDPIWERLGDPKTFDDALGNPYPPFAFNSGYDVADVSRKEAERLGVIAPNAPAPQPQTRDLISDIHASAANFDRALQSALANDPELVIQDGVLGLKASDQ